MESFQVLDADNLVKPLHRLRKCLRTPQVIACSKSVAGINTNPNPLLISHPCDDIPQIFPSRAHNVPLARHILQHSNHMLARLVPLVQPLRDPRDSLSPRLATRVSRVEVVQAYTERVAALQVVDEVGQRLRRLGCVFLRQVDQVGAVREDVRAGCVAVLCCCRKELVPG